MNTKNRRKKLESSPAAQPVAVATKTGEVLRFTLDREMNAVRTNELDDGSAPSRPQGANYLPFWDDGAWMPVRNGLSSGSLLDGEYNI